MIIQIKNMRILSIDPGFERLGIAILDQSPSRKETLIYSQCFKTSPRLSFALRLALIGEELERVIKEYEPKALALEKLYFSNNQKTAMNVAEARGVIIYTASRNKLPVYEYTPPQIKLAVTGYGNADKKMIIDMVPRLISYDKKITSDDEIDAIACGLTCFAHEKFKNTL